jgi:hypothetical protein
VPEQYVATDSASGLEVTVTGDFPDNPDDRVRIARTATLFTRLFATILTTESEMERQHRFRAIETQLEVADALIREDFAEVQRLLHETMSSMGVTEEQLKQIEDELRRHLRQFGGFELPEGDEDGAPGGEGDDEQPV